MIGAEPLAWDDYEAVVYSGAEAGLSPKSRVDEFRAELERQIASGAVIYSVNTGYGAEAGRVVPAEAIERVQANTLRSHAVGIGEPAPVEIVRGMLLLKAQAYAQGPAALRRDVVDGLLAMLNGRVHPLVPLLGSQSASGDLIPNAHIGLALMGEGAVLAGDDRRSVAEAGIQALRPAAKEGVALTNDCSFATALAFDAVRTASRLVERTELAAAMTLQALRGFPDAFDERLVSVRPHAGALASAEHMRHLLGGSELLRTPGRPHDPYSLRCLPQVHGAIRDAIAYARSAVETEIHSIGDNPLVFVDDAVTISGGNIHGEPIAIPMDTLAIALAELAAYSQRRTYHLVNPTLEVGLPPKLSPQPDERFGLLLLNTAASALVSECRGLTAPASTESIAVDEIEDHVSMAAVAARKARSAIELARRVVAIELVCAAQALDFQGPDRASPPVAALHAAVRERVAFVDEDRSLSAEAVLDLL
jgi:histidine ammonia-lyase